MKRAALVVAMLCLTLSVSVQAENWPCWRGPRGDGSSVDQQVPLTWNGKTGKNILWTAAVPGKGHASPIIWNDRVFVVTCDQEKKERRLISLDASTGKTVWSKVVLESLLETKHNLNSYASSTPATDGKHVYVTFLEVDGSTIPAPNVGNSRPVTPGVITVAAYDFNGDRKWLVKPGEFVSAHGFCSSPVIHGDLLIVNGDHDGNSYIVALNRHTGTMVWKIKRKYGIRSYVTPIIREVAGKTQMFVPGSKHLACLDPKDGSEYWRVEGDLPEQYVASPCFDGNYFFMAAGFPTHHVIAVRPDGQGDVTESHVQWHTKDVRCYVPSPVLAGNALFVADDRGTASAFDTKTGEKIWKERMGRHYSASLIATKSHVFFVADDGITKVVKAGEKPKVVEENPLGEFSFASPAIANGRLFIRGENSLYCIGYTKTAAVR